MRYVGEVVGVEVDVAVGVVLEDCGIYGWIDEVMEFFNEAKEKEGARRSAGVIVEYRWNCWNCNGCGG